MIVKLCFFCLRARDALLIRMWQVQGRLLLAVHGVAASRGVRFYGLPILSIAPGSKIQIGERVVLCSNPRFTALGVARPVVLRTLRPQASIRIGADVGISGGVICAASSVDIGNQCLIGADVQIADTDFHPLAASRRRFENRSECIATAPVVIEENVFLGAGVRVLKGVRIGKNSVIGAGSVVTRDIPRDSIAAGVPARVIGSLLQQTSTPVQRTQLPLGAAVVDQSMDGGRP